MVVTVDNCLGDVDSIVTNVITLRPSGFESTNPENKIIYIVSQARSFFITINYPLLIIDWFWFDLDKIRPRSKPTGRCLAHVPEHSLRIPKFSHLGLLGKWW